MSQDLITSNNPSPLIGQGELILSGYFNGWDFTPAQTIPAGIYYYRSSRPIVYVAPVTNGKSPVTNNFLTTNWIILNTDEPNLKIWGTWTATAAAQIQKSDTGVTTTNLIHDGTNFYFAALNSSIQARVLYFSSDAISWSTRSMAAATASVWDSNNYFSLKYDSNVTNKYILAMSTNAATNQIQYSTDAITWSLASCTSSTQGPTNPKINNNLTEKYLVHLLQSSGTATQIATSTDGVTWTSRTTPSGIVRTVADNGGSSGEVYVATTSNTDGSVFTSTDGITWTSRTTGNASTTGAANYINSKWVVFYETHPYLLTTSTDGVTWTLTTIDGVSGVGTTNGRISIVLNNKLFVQSSAGVGRPLISTDGTSWEYGVSVATFIPHVYVNNRYYSGNQTNVYYSPDKTYFALYKVDNQVKVV